jgi:long-chain fatty acid transport protein
MATVPLFTRLFFYSVAVAAIAGVASAPKARAAAFYLQDQSVRGLGRAYSGEVADTGAASLWWNPASIAGSANELYVGGNSVLTSSALSDTGSSSAGPAKPGPLGGAPRADNPVLFGVIPNSAGSFRINDRFAVGLSFAAPYDFVSQYDSNSFARYDSLKARLSTIDAQLTGAMKVTNWLDVGLGFNTEYTSANLAQAYLPLTAGAPDGNLDLKGSSYDFGYTFGARVHDDRWSFGASYKSAITHDLDGRVELTLPGTLAALSQKADGSAKFTTPWIATLGARYNLTSKLTLNVQAERFGWSRFNAINVSAGPTLSQSITQGYRDTTSGAIGLDYAVSPGWIMRAGVGYDQSPTQTRYRNSFVPDSDRMLYTIGTSFKATPRLTVDAAGGYVAFRGSNIDYTTSDYPGTILATNFTEKATVSGNAKILSLGVRYAY